MAVRVTFLVDGFNVYHSIRQAMRDTGARHLRWLDLRSLLGSYLSIFGTTARLGSIHYFTAYADHFANERPDVVARHRTLVDALKSTGVTVHIARFKRKDIRCSSCGEWFIRHEEKETDVAIGVSALALLHQHECEVLVLVSGDTDLIPAIHTCRGLFSENRICVAFPHGRFNTELQQAADFSFRIRPGRYAEHQFPETIRLPSGRVLRKPPAW